MLTKENIEIQMKKEYLSYIKTYSENRILGTFVVGKANYGFAETANDLHFITVYLPTFDELCIGRPNNTYNTIEKNILLDIRMIYSIVSHNDLNLLETLYTDYKIITPKYEKIFYESLWNNRDIISRSNERNRLEKALISLKRAIDRDDLFEVIRLHEAAILYAMKTNTYKCFHFEDPILRQVLLSAIEKKDEFVINYDDIINHMEELINNASAETDMNSVATLKNGVISLISASLTSTINYDTFKDSLTKTEYEAFLYLQKTIGDNEDKNVSISKLIEQTGISRPVWKKLLEKLENSKIAEINNQGMKGTSIKFKQSF